MLNLKHTSMKQIILLLTLSLKLTNMNAGGCAPWLLISNPTAVPYYLDGDYADTLYVTLNPSDSNLIFDLQQSGAGCYSVGGYTNLQWYKNGVPIAGNTHCISAGTGVYTYLSVFGGVNYLNVTIIVTAAASATGVHESQEASGIHIFPNPSTSGIFNLKNEISEKAYSINIYNMTGQFISTKEVNQQSDLLDLSDYNKGLYFLEFIFDDGMKRRQKIIYD